MRAVIQRVSAASVIVSSKVVASIKQGLVIFLGVERADTSLDAQYLTNKIIRLRIFNDRARKMNLCAEEAGAELLVVSQFTLCADLNGSGRRPSFDQAKEPVGAERLYREFIQFLQGSQLKVKEGVFKAEMQVHLENDGPVTFILDSSGG